MLQCFPVRMLNFLPAHLPARLPARLPTCSSLPLQMFRTRPREALATRAIPAAARPASTWSKAHDPNTGNQTSRDGTSCKSRGGRGRQISPPPAQQQQPWAAARS